MKQNSMRRICSALTAFLMLASTAVSAPSAVVCAADSYDMTIDINVDGETKSISPYIYGINQYGNQNAYRDVTVTALRQGGNRMTAYNWETNASNAGSDWKYSSDNNLSTSNAPADCAQVLSKEAKANGIGYKMTTLQMAGYAAADKDGTVKETEAAPSKRWNEVVAAKNEPFAAEPDLTDGKVYMDEYVNYIVSKLGDAASETGIQGYSLDNEPALWAHTHSRIHPQPVGIEELAEKSIELASAVKKVDPKAEIFGPALYGYTAFDHLADDETSDEWEKIKAENGYHWYLDCYLDQMKKAEDACGTRLLDVLDIHYYSESARNGAEDRLQSVRTLYEEGFSENSWIGQWCMENVPILPTVQASIDKYYPDTKLAISEYNFEGGDEISGAIAQAEALGCFADNNVYFASLWGSGSYLYAGINLYTNYNGKGGAFGSDLLQTQTADVSKSSAYAAINGTDKGLVTAMVTNKNMTRSEKAVINLKAAKTAYKSAAVYAVTGESSDIRLIDIIDDVKDNQVTVTLPALSAAMVVITDNPDDLAGESLYNPDQFSYKTVEFTDLDDRINTNGYVEVPVTDPEHLTSVKIIGDVTSSAGSSWATAGCAVSINAVTPDGVGFWTYKDFSLTLGSGVEDTVEFDGIFNNEDEPVEAVIADGKIEFQKWWDASEKDETGVEDNIEMTLKKIVLTYTYENTGGEGTAGDVNADGSVTISDAVMLQKWLTGNGKITDAAAGDINADGKLNAIDFTLLKRLLLKKA